MNAAQQALAENAELWESPHLLNLASTPILVKVSTEDGEEEVVIEELVAKAEFVDLASYLHTELFSQLDSLQEFDLMPFAICRGGGVYFCLSSTRLGGKVFYFCMDTGFTPVAKSATEFLSTLTLQVG